MPPLRLDESSLRGCAVRPDRLATRAVARLVETLGWLAPWWLQPAVLAAAGEHQHAYDCYRSRPALPREPGSCWVVFVQAGSADGALPLPALRPALLLPLRWHADRPHDPHLPGPLRELADLVRQQAGGGSWGLWLAIPPGEEARDLSALDGGVLGVESGWAALLAGLMLLKTDGQPDPHVWASAAWHPDYGIGAVQGLAAKLDLAVEWQVRQMFVPAQNQDDVARWRADHTNLEVEFLAPVRQLGNPAALLTPYRECLRMQPEPGDPWERRRAYYADVGRRQANSFYWDSLLEDSIERCRQHLDANYPDCRPTHLVTVVSNQPAVVALAPAVLQVRRCLLLHEDQPGPIITRNRNQVASFLARRGIEVTTAGVTLGQRSAELPQMREAVRSFAPPQAGRLAFDLTPGYKALSLELEELAPPDSWLLYCRHQQLQPDNRIDPGTERFDCWRHP